MSKVIADITMSLDGYVTGLGADAENGSEMPRAARVGFWAGHRRRGDPRSSDGARW